MTNGGAKRHVEGKQKKVTVVDRPKPEKPKKNDQ